MNHTSNEYQPIIDILIQILGDYNSHNDYKGQISFDCPVCSHEIKGLDVGDGKGNLEVNYKFHVFKCWSCSETHDTHGSIYSLIKKFGNVKQLKRYQLLRPEDNNTGEKKTYKRIFLPKEFIPFSNVTEGIKLLPQYKQAYNYIKRRNISDYQLKKYNIGFCRTGLYENRIIIPSYDIENNVNYFIARSFLSNTKLKYLNPEAQKELIIFNEKYIDWEKPLFLVEGVFDSIFLENSIPMLGKILNDNLHKKLYDNAKHITIVLDPDAREDGEKIYHKLNCGKLMGKVSIIELEGNKDIADLKGEIFDYQVKTLD